MLVEYSGGSGIVLNTKRVTSQDVADLAGVSRTTVSLVLNDVQTVKISPSTRQKVVEAADELGYVPDAAAQALASRRAQIIGLILTRKPHYIASDAFIPQILDGLFDVIHQQGMRLLMDIVEPEHQAEAYLEFVRAKRIDGVLLSGPRFDDDALELLWNEGFPTVLIGQLPGSMFYSVDVNNYAAAKEAVAYLVKKGHSQIACITNAPTTYTASTDRLAGYRDAIEEAGIKYKEELVRFGDFTVDSGYYRMQNLINGSVEFTAAFVASDVVALGAMAALKEKGFNLPKDIALVGFDDLPIARYVDPPLTTVHVPGSKLARKACNLLIQLLGGDEPEQKQFILDTHMVIRDSCGSNGTGLQPN